MKLSYWYNLILDKNILGDLIDDTVLKCGNSLSNLFCVFPYLHETEDRCTKNQNILLYVSTKLRNVSIYLGITDPSTTISTLYLH